MNAGIAWYRLVSRRLVVSMRYSKEKKSESLPFLRANSTRKKIVTQYVHDESQLLQPKQRSTVARINNY